MIRVAVITIAFFAELIFIGPIRTSAGGETPQPMRMNEHAGAALIVACDSGDLAVRRVGTEPGAVQLECAKGKIVVVEERRQRAKSRYHLLGM
jgi:hypothetical protein